MDRWLTRTNLATAALMALASATSGTELILKNDSMTNGSSTTACQCFITGDVPAVWLTAPVAGTIVGVQVFWKSPLGGAPDTQETAIRLYNGGSFPTPGAVMQNDGGGDAEVIAPILSDGSLNEFRFLDMAQSIPMSVSVGAGQTIAVGLEIFNQSSGGGSFTPSLTFDADGCQSSKNAVFVFDQSAWFDACPLGVTGDWVIRAILDSDSPIPAASHWGLVQLILGVMTAGTIACRRAGAEAQGESFRRDHET